MNSRKRRSRSQPCFCGHTKTGLARRDSPWTPSLGSLLISCAVLTSLHSRRHLGKSAASAALGRQPLPQGIGRQVGGSRPEVSDPPGARKALQFVNLNRPHYPARPAAAGDQALRPAASPMRRMLLNQRRATSRRRPVPAGTGTEPAEADSRSIARWAPERRCEPSTFRAWLQGSPTEASIRAATLMSPPDGR